MPDLSRDRVALAIGNLVLDKLALQEELERFKSTLEELRRQATQAVQEGGGVDGV